MVFGFGKKFKCATCGLSFKTEAELMEHNTKMHPVSANSPSPMASSMSASQFKCSTCGMTFTTRVELMEHSKKAHGA